VEYDRYYREHHSITDYNYNLFCYGNGWRQLHGNSDTNGDGECESNSSDQHSGSDM
jgi:hypothetical protein